MENKYLTGALLKEMFISGAKELNKYKNVVDSLNVFPVPDGDTGTNMSLTILAAAGEVEKTDDSRVDIVANAASGGSLRGARGNSGVILSQLLRGFAKELEGKEVADKLDLAFALKRAAETAYKAVMKPKEGTVLTIAREAYVKAFELADANLNIEEFLKEIINHCNHILLKTPDMLPQLKQAGVVDAGGKGLLCFLEGAYKYKTSPEHEPTDEITNTADFSALNKIENDGITFGYCTEFFINTDNIEDSVIDNIKQYLETIGDSIVVAASDNIIKVHVHSDHPGLIIEKALEIGSLTHLKIDNMREQHTAKIEFDSPEQKEIGFVAVSIGKGIKDTFLNLGADVVIEGGQTMNPSTNDILKAISQINAKNVIILPNNKNIILAAEQAKLLSENKNITVIPAKSIPQGITAMIAYDKTNSLDDNIEIMTESISRVKTGLVTYAVRDTVIDEYTIAQGDFIGMQDGKIVAVEKKLQETTKQLIIKMLDEEHEIISIYYGSDVTEQLALEIERFISGNYSHYDIELYNGAQPLYYYIISVE